MDTQITGTLIMIILTIHIFLLTVMGGIAKTTHIKTRDLIHISQATIILLQTIIPISHIHITPIRHPHTPLIHIAIHNILITHILRLHIMIMLIATIPTTLTTRTDIAIRTNILIIHRTIGSGR